MGSVWRSFGLSSFEGGVIGVWWIESRDAAWRLTQAKPLGKELAKQKCQQSPS